MAQLTLARTGPASLLRRASPLMAARAVGAGFSFCIPLVLARALSLDGFGTWKLLALVAQTLFYVLPFGVAQSLFYFLPRTQERRGILGQTLVFLLGASAVGGGVMYLFADVLAAWLANPAVHALRLPLVLYVVGIVLALPLDSAFTASGRMGVSAWASLVSDVLRTSAIILPALAGAGVPGVMWSLAAYAIARAVITWAALLWIERGRIFGFGSFGAQLRYALPFGAAMLLAVPQQQLHQFVVAGMLGPAAFAIYAVAFAQLPVIDFVYGPVNEVLMVRLAELGPGAPSEDRWGAFNDATAQLARYFLPLTVLSVIAAPEIVFAMYGEKFADAVPLFRLAALTLLFNVLPVDATLRATGHTRRILLGCAVKAVLTGPLIAVGLELFRLPGAIAATLVVEVLGTALLLAWLPAALGPVRPVALARRVLVSPVLLRTAAGTVLAAAAVYAVRASTDPGTWGAVGGELIQRVLPLALVMAVFGGIYGGWLVLTEGVRRWS